MATESDIDLASDWALVKQARTTRTSESNGDSEELESSWRTLKNLPDVLYVAREGYGIETMTLFVYRCHGQIQSSKGQRAGTDNWRGSFDRVIWMGSGAEVHPSDGKGTIFTMPKDQVDLTLEEAIARLDKFREKHIATFRESRANIESKIADLYADLARCIKRTTAAETTTMSDVILASLRAELLATLHLRSGSAPSRETTAKWLVIDDKGRVVDDKGRVLDEPTLTPIQKITHCLIAAGWECKPSDTSVKHVFDNGPEIPDFSRGGDGPSAPPCRGCGQNHWNTCR